ncbi:hypothetical protein QBC40DRAFT_320306 [Triangularia verruculosa]|uniref:Uncharacterized protein n=1 Tax=Triangularia verruculosa TaxID=2587418 RepID=A0AAN7AZM6_9PEZI|nr:hypothetical protein QBC40DRAFT_320306 [Triangularia verruculosa]
MSNRQSALLRVPVSIRNRIYYLCARTSSPYPTSRFIFALNSWRESRRFNEPARNIHSLLQSCKTVYEEVIAFLYSSGIFVIRYSGPGSLEPLQWLSTTALASLTCLKIVLNQAACHYQLRSFSCCSEGEFPCWAGTLEDSCRNTICKIVAAKPREPHGPPLRCHDIQGQDMLAEWQAVVVHLSHGLTAGRLELALVCDIASREPDIATAVITPLRLLPRLRDCHVRLSAARETKLQQMAEALVANLTGDMHRSPILNTTSRGAACELLNLPREIRLRILEYTDLVTPLKEVNWSRLVNGYWASQMSPRNVSVDPDCPSDIRNGCQFSWCWHQPNYKAPIGCFCRVYHSSASSFCGCWAPPAALFLVCRRLCDEARYVFFSRNRFIVRDNFERLDLLDYPYNSFAASDFLKRIVPERSLPHLRFLELVFPPFSYSTWPRADHPASNDWRETLQWSRGRLNLPALTIRLEDECELKDRWERFVLGDERYESQCCEGEEPLYSSWTCHRIYSFLGVASQDYQARHVFDLHRNHRMSERLKRQKRRLEFYGLLLSCRTIYKEAAALLYSANIFIIHAESSTGPFDPLLALTTTALSSLTHLKIVVNQTSCHLKVSEVHSVSDCCLATDEPFGPGRSWCGANHDKLHQAALRSTEPSAISLLKDWNTAARHLSEISPGSMTLFFVCHVEHGDVEAGRLALAPLLRLPCLKSCHVRISKRPNLQLRRLADDAVQKSIGIAAPMTSSGVTSHFLNLPRELRLRILGFTDLVTPIKEVSWDGQAYRANRPTYSMPHQAGYNDNLQFCCRRDHHYGCQFRNCWLKPERSADYHAGCFCRLEHTAVSSLCQCWAPPTYLFLICRTLYYETQHIFFFANRFIIHDYGDLMNPRNFAALPWVETYPNTRLTASRFLRDQVPGSSLRSLRLLELTFPAYSYHAWPTSEHTAITDWIETIEYIKDKINGPGLTLRGYKSILSPLTRLSQDSRGGPLHRFYAHLAYHWAYTQDNLSMAGTDVQKYYRFIRCQEKRLKEEAERMYAKAPSDDDEDIPCHGIEHFHEVSQEVLNKPLEAWEGEEREGKEPRISFWHFCHEVMRSSG